MSDKGAAPALVPADQPGDGSQLMSFQEDAKLAGISEMAGYKRIRQGELMYTCNASSRKRIIVAGRDTGKGGRRSDPLSSCLSRAYVRLPALPALPADRNGFIVATVNRHHEMLCLTLLTGPTRGRRIVLIFELRVTKKDRCSGSDDDHAGDDVAHHRQSGISARDAFASHQFRTATDRCPCCPVSDSPGEFPDGLACPGSPIVFETPQDCPLDDIAKLVQSLRPPSLQIPSVTCGGGRVFGGPATALLLGRGINVSTAKEAEHPGAWHPAQESRRPVHVTGAASPPFRYSLLMDQQSLLSPSGSWQTLDYLSIISKERAGRVDVLAIESGLVSIDGGKPQKGCFVVFDNAYGFYFGMRPFIGVLKWDAHPSDFCIPIRKVKALHVSGATKETAPQYAYDPRLNVQTGQPFVLVTSKKRGAIQFGPNTAKTFTATGVMASQILAGQRSVYSDHVRGKVAEPVSRPMEDGTGTFIGHRPDDVLRMASRYFPQRATYDVGMESYVLPCRRRLTRDPIFPATLFLTKATVASSNRMTLRRQLHANALL